MQLELFHIDRRNIYIYIEKENIRSKEDDYIQEPITDNFVLLIFLNTSIKY